MKYSEQSFIFIYISFNYTPFTIQNTDDVVATNCLLGINRFICAVLSLSKGIALV